MYQHLPRHYSAGIRLDRTRVKMAATIVITMVMEANGRCHMILEVFQQGTVEGRRSSFDFLSVADLECAPESIE